MIQILLYMYKSYLDAELSLPKSAKGTYLSAAGYYTDENQDAAANEGFNKIVLNYSKQVGRYN